MEEQPEGPRKKKKRKAAPAGVEAPAALVTSPPPSKSTFTGAHVAGALVLGLAIGGLGGYLVAKPGAPSAERERRPERSGQPAADSGAPGAQSKGPRRPQREAINANVPLAAHSPRRGPAAAKVTILEFADFQCPACAASVPVLKEVTNAYPEDVVLYFRHFPLASHKLAEPAARAVQAAQRQGKAWELMEKLFQSKGFKEDDVPKLAGEVGVDMTKFEADFASPEVKAEVDADRDAGKTAKVAATPTIYINGKHHTTGRNLQAMKPVIDAEIAEANALIAAGTKLEDVYAARAKANAGE